MRASGPVPWVTWIRRPRWSYWYVVGFRPGICRVNGRPRASPVVVTVRPSAVVTVAVRVVTSKTVVNVRPLTVTVSVWRSKLPLLSTFTLRADCVSELSPLGRTTVWLARSGACMPRRGSGICLRATVLPSALVCMLVPSLRSMRMYSRPSGVVWTIRRPSSRGMVSNVCSRPSAEVMVTVWPSSVLVRVRVEPPPAAFVSESR